MARMEISASSCASQSTAFAAKARFCGFTCANRSCRKSASPMTTRRPPARTASAAAPSPSAVAAGGSTATAMICGPSSAGSGSGGTSGAMMVPVACRPPNSVVVNSGRTRALSVISSGVAQPRLSALSPRVSVWSLSAGSTTGQYG